MLTVSQNIICIYWFNLLFLFSCSGDNYEKAQQEIVSLESLKEMFDQRLITHVDFKTTQQDDIFNDEIIAMELIEHDEVVSFSHIKLASKAKNGAMHYARLTLNDHAFGITIKGMNFNPWAKTLIYFNGNEIKEFAPYTSIFESGITSSGLNILSDTLQIHFY